MTPEHEKARAWREARNLTVERLAELSGYSTVSIYWFERGLTPPMRNAKGGHARDRAHKPWVFLRYKLACGAVDRMLKTGKSFDW
jgi:transcriptional regulator with XRE-family HTH domain